MLHPMRAALCALAVASALLLSACGGDAAPATRLTPAAEPTAGDSGIVYWTDHGTALRLDACLPAERPDAGAPSVVLLHGGGFTTGSRDTGGTATVCSLMADSGVAAFSVDYRLAPGAVYPTQVQDVQHALRWLREPAQVRRFEIDPARIGLLGSSAGAILAQTVATAGSGPDTAGDRVKAVVSLSGVSDFTPAARRLGTPSQEVQQIALDYLGCDVITDCPQSAKASAVEQVDRTDPPMLLVNGSDEIVPKQQAEAMQRALRSSRVPVQLMVRPGSAHGFTLLDGDVRDAVRTFLAKNL